MYRKHFQIHVSRLVFRKYRDRPVAVCDQISKGGIRFQYGGGLALRGWGVDFGMGGLTPLETMMMLYIKMTSFSDIENAFNRFFGEFPTGFVFVISTKNVLKNVKCANIGKKGPKSSFFRRL